MTFFCPHNEVRVLVWFCTLWNILLGMMSVLNAYILNELMNKFSYYLVY